MKQTVQWTDCSEQRRCSVVGADRTSIRYRSCRPDDTHLRERLRTLAGERRRFGYRRLHVLLRREGHSVNHKKAQRIYPEEGLSVRKRKGRKKASGTRSAARPLRPARNRANFNHRLCVQVDE